ncbi:carotenoid oxygenase family protein [Caballeronia sp. LZ029]|uniref:carotenoid oxygenase family protein n=1 Tax=Caballeronia sp. LZ029 TaxID=3038564 RepID=UPI003857552A
MFDPSQTDACAASEPLGDLTDELSRIDDCMMGQHYRNGWLAAHGDEPGATFSRIAHVDHDRPTDADIWTLRICNATPSAGVHAVVVRCAEGEGWILAAVYRGCNSRPGSAQRSSGARCDDRVGRTDRDRGSALLCAERLFR